MNCLIRVFLFLFALLAVATAHPKPKPSKTHSTSAPTSTPTSQCNTGPIQCCQTVEPASSSSASSLLGLLGIVLGNLNVPVGLTCSPLSVIGVGSNSCDASPVCCENNSFNGVIAIGCVPININL
ncbi:hydrophobin 2 [Phellopilus nigrolimitatus]|nr:hydrophobin 2 [Phellopilus nigrolimitatus]